MFKAIYFKAIYYAYFVIFRNYVVKSNFALVCVKRLCSNNFQMVDNFSAIIFSSWIKEVMGGTW